MPQRPAASRAAGSGTQATAVAGLKGGVTAQEQSGAASAASITSNGDAREGPAGAEVSFEGRPVEAMVVRVGLQCRAGEEERVAGAAEVLVSGERLTGEGQGRKLGWHWLAVACREIDCCGLCVPRGFFQNCVDM